MKTNIDRIEKGKYNIIYADPPWRFKNWSMSELAKHGEKWARRNGRSPYDVMNLDDGFDVWGNEIKNDIELKLESRKEIE